MLKRQHLIIFVGLFCACPRTHLQKELSTRSYFQGWYEKGHKVGYLQTIVQEYPDRFRFERRGKLTTEMMGTPVAASPNSVCNTDRSFALKDFNFTMVTPGHQFQVSGRVRDGRVVMTSESGNAHQTSSLEVAGPVYPLEALPSLIRSKNLELNRKYTVTVFDPMVQKTSEAEITLLSRDKLVIRDSTYDVMRVSALLFGVPNTVWIDTFGRVLRSESPPSSLMILEPATTAMAAVLEQTPPDIMGMFAVPSNIRLDNARQLRQMNIELGGIDPKGFDLADESQKILNYAPLRLQIAPGRPPAIVPPLPISGEPDALKPTLSVQSDNPQVIRRAREIAGNRTDANAVARDILQWTFANIRQTGTPSLPSAADVLKTMEGDCNEHAVLYAALCRAVGIPCRICVGLVYRDGYFWYHAWNKVYLGAWVPVDATFGQFPVDATHLKLKEGEMDQQARVLTIVGNLVIKVTDYR